ncbi:MAG: ribosome maturation factor RimM [Bacteroidales bacterium]|nr:ribosome maturation factor RimM [Bacteroidales bacterium]MDD3859991.1 ribosome maturation factor RimM [Bacteroidales bacterium]
MFFGKDELILVAHVLKTHGLTGNLFLSIHDDFSNSIIKENKPVFLFKEGIPVPFSLESVKSSGNNLIVKFRHINNIEKANNFIGCEVYVLSEIINDNTEDDFSFEFDGFSVFDKQYGFIGNVKNFDMIPGNPIFETELNGKTIIIPYSEDIISKVDEFRREIYINAPEGLIEIYLNS